MSRRNVSGCFLPNGQSGINGHFYKLYRTTLSRQTLYYIEKVVCRHIDSIFGLNIRWTLSTCGSKKDRQVIFSLAKFSFELYINIYIYN